MKIEHRMAGVKTFVVIYPFLDDSSPVHETDTCIVVNDDSITLHPKMDGLDKLIGVKYLTDAAAHQLADGLEEARSRVHELARINARVAELRR